MLRKKGTDFDRAVLLFEQIKRTLTSILEKRNLLTFIFAIIQR